MKPSLQFNVNQQLTLNPQLQQAINLLQLSTLELQQEIQQQVEINPLLEIAANEENEEIPNTNSEDEFLDFQWSHLYNSQSTTKPFNEPDYQYEQLYSTTLNLKDHLHWQLNLTPMTEKDKIIAITIIDAIDDNGFLSLSPKDLYAHLIKDIKSLKFDECETVRHRIQLFDPIGCATTCLAETLMIQLNQLPKTTPNLDIAQNIIQNHMILLGQHNYAKLRKLHRISEKKMSDVLTLILHLNPRPGTMVLSHSPEFITPDLFVKKSDKTWGVHLNPTIIPKLRINNDYASLMRETKNHDDYQFIRNNLHDARCFLKNIQNRQETLFKVARYIIEFQHDFIETGEKAMKPLILNDVANALGLSESTISRVTTQKFIHTPRGLFELKYFFSNHVPTNNGEKRSSTAIRAQIKAIIASESHKKPFNDNEITGILSQQGIQIARRTITKYRELLGIAPSNERKIIQSD